MKPGFFLWLAAWVALCLSAEQLPFEESSHELILDQSEPGLGSETVVAKPGASWLRLKFGRDSRVTGGVRITSLKDGFTQHLNQVSLQQWQYTSAYFNGDSVLVELMDEVKAQKLHITGFLAGTELKQPKSICNLEDTRVLSSVKRSGRYLGSGGCTGWLINDKNRCFLSAHHCGMDSNGGGVMQFEVPMSEPTLGGHRIVHPPPEHQYSVDPNSFVRAQSPVGIGNDWQYFGCFPNSETGLTPFERQQDSYVLSLNMTAPSSGSPVEINGFGTVEFDQPKEWNQVQKFSKGTFSHDKIDGQKWSMYYTVDTTGGDSGSAVEVGGLAIGVHTHGGCSRIYGGTNSGTFIGNPSLQKALQSPRGVCAP